MTPLASSKASCRPSHAYTADQRLVDATRWLVDIGTPFSANLDRIDADEAAPLDVGSAVEIIVKRQNDRMMMPFVSSRPEVLARAGRQIDLPTDLRGEIVWPPPIEERQSE